MAKYTAEQYFADKKRLEELIDKKLQYVSQDVHTYRCTYRDTDLAITVNFYLSKRSVTITSESYKTVPYTLRKLTWRGIEATINNLWKFV